MLRQIVAMLSNTRIFSNASSVAPVIRKNVAENAITDRYSIVLFSNHYILPSCRIQPRCYGQPFATMRVNIKEWVNWLATLN